MVYCIVCFILYSIMLWYSMLWSGMPEAAALPPLGLPDVFLVDSDPGEDFESQVFFQGAHKVKRFGCIVWQVLEMWNEQSWRKCTVSESRQ